MAEANKSGIFAKAQKRISRTKTKVLQTLGKAEKYTDETFDDLVQRTEKQHDVAHHLQKEIKSYVSCMRALSNASKSLAAALGTTYEEEWTDEMGFKKMLEAQDLLWTDYLDSVQNCVMEPMNKYLATFPPLKVRTAKRGRKMMDFDNARHNLEVLQAAKKRDEAKIAKAQEELNESKQIFEELHSELCTELPNFYNSRVTFYADLFQKLFTCENTLHTELARISQGLNDTSEKLSKDHVQFVYTPKRPLSKSLSDNVVRTENSTFYYGSDEQPLNGDSSPRPGTGTGTDSPASSASPAATPTTPTAVPRPSPAPVAASAGGGGGGVGVSVKEEQEDGDGEDDDHVYGNQDAVAAAKVNGDVDSAPKSESPPPPTPPPQEETTTPASAPAVESAFAEEGCPSDPSALADDSLAAKARSVYNTHNGPQSTGDAEGGNVYEVPPKGGEEEEEEDSEDEDGAVYQSPPSNKPVYEAPPSTLYQVEATHAYCGEDIDELSFDPGDIIYVVPFENEDEQPREQTDKTVCIRNGFVLLFCHVLCGVTVCWRPAVTNSIRSRDVGTLPAQRCGLTGQSVSVCSSGDI
ncbi:uncharacterized protein LOC143276539 isoform X2 [Babylonia areolata]|uniref:uncharacterized protein LOC143276539 isoform X2 n=1 Tax=Babylonia areolata TaxID=304850 RepID=UPI003FD3450C